MGNSLRYCLVNRFLFCCLVFGIIFSCLMGRQNAFSASYCSLSEPESMYYIFNNTVTVASLFKEPSDSAPATVIVVTAREIKERGYQDLTDVLEDLPGFDVQKRIGGQPGGAYVIVRGLLGNNKLKVFIDGVPLNPANGSHLVYGEHISVQGLKQIEVMYGPASALYGSNAFSGIINLITKDIPDKPVAHVKLQAGNNDTFSGYVLAGARLAKDLKAQIYAHGYRTSGFDMRKEYRGDLVDNGTGVKTPVYSPSLPYNNPRQDYDGFLQAKAGKWHFLVTYNHTRQPNNIQTPYYTGRSQLPKDKAVIDTLNFDTNNEFNISSNLKLRSDFWYQHYELEPESDYGRFTFNNYIYERSDAFNLDERLIYSFTRGKLVYGVNIKRVTAFPYINSSTPFDHGDAYYDFPLVKVVSPSGDVINIRPVTLKRYWVLGNYFQFTRDIAHNLIFTGGVRYDYDSLNRQGSVNPRVGLVYSISQNQFLKLLFGTAYISPSVYYRYKAWSDGDNNYAHLPLGLFGKKLKSEKLYSIELSHVYDIHRSFSSLISIYFEQANNMIQEEGKKLTDYTFYYRDGTVATNGVVEVPINSGIQTDFGLDLMEKYRFWRHWFVYLGYSYLNARIRLNGVNFDAPKVSDHKVYVGINGVLDKFGFDLNGRWWSGIHTQLSNPMYRGRKIKGELIVNAHIRWLEWAPRVEIDFTVRNLFNTKYFTAGVASEDPTYGTALPKIPQDPREWWLGVCCKF